MKKFITVFTLLMALFVLGPNTIKAEEPVYGETYDVLMSVHEDGTIDVDISFDVMFNEPRQGIYLTVPQTYHMDMEINGQVQSKKYFFKISDVYSRSHELDTESSRHGVVMRLGSAGVYIEGLQTYHINYRIQTTDLGLDGLQMFYMNMFPQDLEFPVNQLNYVVQFEKPIDGSYFTYPPQSASYEEELHGNQIVGSYKGELGRGKTVTLEVELGNDYFVFPETDFIKPMFVVGVFVTLVAIAIFLLYGRDPIVIETVEFKAPEGLSSAEIGYVYRGMAMTKDVVSLIVYWASLGYLRIHELEDPFDDIALEKIEELPMGGNVEERRLFNKIFAKDDYVSLSSLKNKIGETVLFVQSAISKRFTKNPEDRVYDRASSLMKVLSIFLIPLIPASMAYAVVLLKSGFASDGLVGFFVGYGLFFVIAVIGSSVLAFDRIYKKNQRVTIAIVVNAVVFLFGYTGALIFGNGDNKIIVLSTLVLFSIALFFTANTSRRTQKGADWVGQIRGLKRFIEIAEKDRLEALVEETPYIFYDVLPYAYVLGVSDVWMKKFEDIAIQTPDWYVSTNPNLSTYILLSSLNRSMNTMSTSLSSFEVSSGSGGGSFGGGGGGGFSGGGFGGGGGGSW